MYQEALRKVEAEYTLLREENSATDLEREIAVRARVPEIGRLMDQRKDLIFRSFRSFFSGEQATGQVSIPEETERLSREIRRLLRVSGYPEDYLQPVCHCQVCQDRGYVGEPIREMCSCMKNRLYRMIYEESGIGPNPPSFETFDEKVFPDDIVPELKISQRMEMVTLRDQLQNWAQKWPDTEKSGGVVLSGASGLGKTFLIHCMARELLDRGKSVSVLTAYRALDILRESYFQGHAEDQDLLFEPDVLFLDDLGTEPLLNNVTITQLFNLLNERERMSSKKKKAFVVSTNYSQSGLRERYTERLTSRLLDSRNVLIFALRGADVRKRG
ncbi:MAG: ATP-binding protein [Clostridia bacterium]|nr:ATP-binding protein [Clostridia bacterium]